MPGPRPAPRSPPQNGSGATASELCTARFSLLLAGITNDEAHTPTFTDEFEAILEGSGDRKLKQQLTGGFFDNTQEDSCATQSTLRVHVDFPKLQRLALAQLLGGEWAREPVRSLANLSLSFSLLYFLPHTPTQWADEHRRQMQELMGEKTARWRSSPRLCRVLAASRTSRPSTPSSRI